LGLFPVLAQADSSGTQYSEGTPKATGGSETPAHTSTTKGGGQSAPAQTSPPVSPESGYSSEGSYSGSGGTNGGGTGQGSQDKGSGGAQKTAQQQSPTANVSHTTPSSDGGSSPVVPILLAIAVLAAISIGAVTMRRKRHQRSSGASVSSSAN
jgi:cobalamin biosynthesis Mg chelatase CobN